MAANSILTLSIPDIDVVVRNDADLRRWVTTSLSELLIKRLKALKEASDEAKALTNRAVVIDVLL
jgi:hypothetical protein